VSCSVASSAGKNDSTRSSWSVTSSGVPSVAIVVKNVLVDTYLAMWNESDAARHAQHIERAWGADGHYVDPMLEAEGHAALGEMVVSVQAKFPGHWFRRTSGVDVHHAELRFGWQLVAPDGNVVVSGIDVGTVGAGGRLSRFTGFFGELPEAA
jgi:hypothetical protein